MEISENYYTLLSEDNDGDDNGNVSSSINQVENDQEIFRSLMIVVIYLCTDFCM